MAPKIIYITGFRQHAGKTVTSLGLISQLSRFIAPEKIGYIKPVGQELSALSDGRMVDKDALVIERFAGIPDLDMAYVSPVRLGSGFTKRFLKEADYQTASHKLQNNIDEAIASLAHKEVIIAEGTGHPGVGGIVGLSNSRVSRLLNASVVYLSGGGIGRALDMLEVDLTYFAHCGTDMRGIIFNKLIPDKIDTVKEYITEKLIRDRYANFPQPLNIFGYLPEVPDLGRPSMRILKKKFNGCHSFGDPGTPAWEKPCRRIRTISLSNDKLTLTKHISTGDLIVLAGASRRRLKRILEYNKDHKEPIALAGIVLTLEELSDMEPAMEKMIIDSGIPTLMVREDTADAESKILDIFAGTKLQIYDTKKYKDVVNLFETHFDTDKFMHSMDISKSR